MKILLAEDDNDHAFLLKRAFQAEKFTGEIQVREDGRTAWDYLLRKKDENDLPDLVLLDLNMPAMNGFEVLEAIMSDSKLRGLPVVILTSSERESDSSRALSAGAAAFLSKPGTFQGFREVAARLFQS